MLTGSAYKVNIVMMIIISPIILGIYIYAMRKYKVDLKKIYDCIIIDKDIRGRHQGTPLRRDTSAS